VLPCIAQLRTDKSQSVGWIGYFTHAAKTAIAQRRLPIGDALPSADAPLIDGWCRRKNRNITIPKYNGTFKSRAVI